MMMDINQPQAEQIQFPKGREATVVRALPTASSRDVFAALGLPNTRFSIVMHGGAAEMDKGMHERMVELLYDGVVRLASDNYALVASGGTQSGAMAALGEAYQRFGGDFPLVGVSVLDSVTYPKGPEPAEGRWPLEPSHTHFILVDGDDFGFESQQLVGLAKAGGNYGVALAVNGGGLVRAEIEMHARLGTPIIAFAGSGRYADELANASTGDEVRAAFDEGSTLRIFDLNRQTPEDLYRMIRSLIAR